MTGRASPALVAAATPAPGASSPGAAAAPRATPHYLHPGQLVASGESLLVSTILGSCVSVCLHDARARVGGINHFLLPDGGHAVGSARYGDEACRQLLERMLALGARLRDLQSIVVGGATVLDGFAVGSPASRLGERNAGAAIAFLELQRIPVIRQDVGGRTGRKLRFRTSDGRYEIASI